MELAAMEEFIKALRDDRAPGVEEYLERFPEFAGSLRPVLEGAVIFQREYRLLEEKYPDVDLGRVLGGASFSVRQNRGAR
jgi:hypothetical protein